MTFAADNCLLPFIVEGIKADGVAKKPVGPSDVPPTKIPECLLQEGFGAPESVKMGTGQSTFSYATFAKAASILFL